MAVSSRGRLWHPAPHLSEQPVGSLTQISRDQPHVDTQLSEYGSGGCPSPRVTVAVAVGSVVRAVTSRHRARSRGWTGLCAAATGQTIAGAGEDDSSDDQGVGAVGLDATRLRIARVIWGFMLVIFWQIIGINLLRWDTQASAFMHWKDRAGSYSVSASLLYACIGSSLLLIRHWPPVLVKPRREAWTFFVSTFVTSGCPYWYKRHATETLVDWLDNSFSCVYSALATRLLSRMIPWAGEFLNLVLPYVGNETRLLGSQSRRLIYEYAKETILKVFGSLLVLLFGRMLLHLKHPGSYGVRIPSARREAMKGCAILWKPLVWFVWTKRKPKLRTQSMRVVLVDKVLTCFIYAAMAIPVLQLLRLKVRTVLAVGGVGGLAIGLALQNLAQNAIAGILLYVNGCVCEGLEVEMTSTKMAGVVAHVGWLTTMVNRYDGMQVLVPNRQIIDSTVVDRTNRRYRMLDEQLIVTFEDQTKIDLLVENVQTMLLRDERILQSKQVQRVHTANQGNVKVYEPQFVFQGWCDYGAKFRIRAFFPGTLKGDLWIEERSKVLLEVNRQISDLGGKVGCRGVVPKPSET